MGLFQLQVAQVQRKLEREKDTFLLDDVSKSLGLDRTCGSLYPLSTQCLLSSLGGQGGIAQLQVCTEGDPLLHHQARPESSL